MEDWNWKRMARGAALGALVSSPLLALTPGKTAPKPTSRPAPTSQARQPESAQAEPEIRPKPESQPAKSQPKTQPKTQPKPQPKPQSQPKPNQLTANFNLSEFASKDGSRTPPQVVVKLKELAQNLQVLRDVVGVPISLTSGYRSPEHNARVGGVSNSQHVQGTAADIRISGMKPKEVHALIEKLIADGKMAQGGLGLYTKQGFVHYDIRGTASRWGK